jgi:hypothetical protein
MLAVVADPWSYIGIYNGLLKRLVNNPSVGELYNFFSKSCNSHYARTIIFTQVMV